MTEGLSGPGDEGAKNTENKRPYPPPSKLFIGEEPSDRHTQAEGLRIMADLVAKQGGPSVTREDPLIRALNVTMGDPSAPGYQESLQQVFGAPELRVEQTMREKGVIDP